MSFSDENVLKLIQLYKQFACLWDFKSPGYRRIDKKKNAWAEISKEMEKSEDVVKKKVKNLRSAYLLEKKKVASSKKSGSGFNAVYEPHLFYYIEMQFLDQAISQRQTTSNLETESDFVEYTPSTQSNEDTEESFTYFSEVGTPLTTKKTSSKKLKLKNAEKLNCALDSLIEQVNNEKSENQNMFSVFGKSIGMQSAVLPLNLATETMAEIQRLLSQKMCTASKGDIIRDAVYEEDIF